MGFRDMLRAQQSLSRRHSQRRAARKQRSHRRWPRARDAVPVFGRGLYHHAAIAHRRDRQAISRPSCRTHSQTVRDDA
jgi:hypothetical protein